jgi:phosphoribosylformimino-5-aminoimidazole carboxamide ribotide isomerase
MFPIPAIDLKGGRVVRLLQGKFDEESVYAEEAHEVARRFSEDGAQRIHVVDLDGALKGEPKNLALVEKILRTVKTPVEVGGGIREIPQAARYLEMGARYVILGTQACLDAGFLKEALAEFGEKAIIGIDASNGFVATDGWTRVLKEKAADLAKRVEALGGRTIIYTDIAKDGALAGPNLAQISEIADTVKLDVIASGGVGKTADLEALKNLKKKNVRAVIVGKALYEKKFSLKEAIAACS